MPRAHQIACSLTLSPMSSSTAAPLEIALPSTHFPASAMGKAICRAMPVPGGRFFGAFEEKTLECNAAARRAIDKVCNQGGYTQAWAHNAGEDGFVAMTKIPVVILVKLLLSIPKEGHEA